MSPIPNTYAALESALPAKFRPCTPTTADGHVHISVEIEPAPAPIGTSTTTMCGATATVTGPHPGPISVHVTCWDDFINQ